MKSDAAAKHLTPLLGWLIGECRRFCQATGRDGLSEADREVLMEAFKQLDWKALGSFGRNRQTVIGAINDIFMGGLVTPTAQRPVELNGQPRDGPIPTDLATFAKELAAEFFRTHESDWAKSLVVRCTTIQNVAPIPNGARPSTATALQFLADLKFGLISAFAVFPAGDGFRPEIGDWVIQTKQSSWLGTDPVDVGPRVHDRQGDPSMARGVRSFTMVRVRILTGRRKSIFLEGDFEIHELYAICPNGVKLNRKPHVFVRGSSEQWRYQAKKLNCQGCPRRAKWHDRQRAADALRERVSGRLGNSRHSA